MSTRIFNAFLLTAGFAFAQPATTPPAAAKPKPVVPAAAKPAPVVAKPAAVVAPAKPKLEPGLYAVISVVQGTAPMGDITLKLYEQESPITVKNFTDLAQGRKPWLERARTGSEISRLLVTLLNEERLPLCPRHRLGRDPSSSLANG